MTYTANNHHIDEQDVYSYMMDGEDGFSEEEARELLGGNWKRMRLGDDSNSVWIERSW